MALLFEVVDLRTDIIYASETVAGAASPEEAARKVLGMDVFRSGRRQDLVARVYWQRPGEAKSMVRLYSRSLFK